MNQPTVLGFHVSGHACALRVEEMREVVPIAALTTVPGQPSLLEGFLNLRGEVIPVVRLDRVLNLPPETATLSSPILIACTGGLTAGLLVGSVDQVFLSDPAAIVTPVEPHQSLNDCAEAQIRLGDVDLTLLALDRILLEKERQCISELAREVKARLSLLDRTPG